MSRRRGDNIPPVSDYSHWNEDAERIWYEENKYDMEHADEIIEDEDDFNYDGDDEDPEPDFSEEFLTHEEALTYYNSIRSETGGRDAMGSHRDPVTGQITWYVEGWRR